jgi:hypothetical protein
MTSTNLGVRRLGAAFPKNATVAEDGLRFLQRPKKGGAKSPNSKAGRMLK